MLTKGQYNTLIFICLLILATTIGNIGLYFTSADHKNALNNKYEYIKQTESLVAINQNVIKIMAELYVSNNDQETLNILNSHGYRVNKKDSDQ